MSDETPVRIGFTKEESAVIAEALNGYLSVLGSVKMEDDLDSLPVVIRIAARRAKGQAEETARELHRRSYDFAHGPQ